MRSLRDLANPCHHAPEVPVVRTGPIGQVAVKTACLRQVRVGALKIPNGVFVALFAKEKLAVHRKFLFHRVARNNRIEVGLVFPGLGPQHPA